MKVPDHKLVAAAKAGQTIQEIAEGVGLSYETARRRLKELKVKATRPITETWTLAELQAAYKETGSAYAAAALLSARGKKERPKRRISRQAVWQRLRTAGVA